MAITPRTETIQLLDARKVRPRTAIGHWEHRPTVSSLTVRAYGLDITADILPGINGLDWIIQLIGPDSTHHIFRGAGAPTLDYAQAQVLIAVQDYLTGKEDFE